MKKYNRTLLVALLIVAVFATAIGGTFAWFTDNVEVTGNVIESGTLDIDIELKKGDSWISLEKNPETKIYNYDLWEPGYTQVETMKIVNKGNLALEYILNVVPGADEKKGPSNESLADVIDVYMAFGEKEPTSFADIAQYKDTPDYQNGWWYCGTLSKMITDEKGFTQGYMLPSGKTNAPDGVLEVGLMQGSCTCTVALHMQESAGNEYQNLSLGTVGFKLEARQYTYEEDAFDNQYDLNALWHHETNNAPIINEELPPANMEVLSGDALTITLGDKLNTLDDVPASMLVEGTTDKMTLDCGLVFTATQEVADIQGKPYEDWNADFTVTTNKSITKADCENGIVPIVLAGQYDFWDVNWMPIPVVADDSFSVEAGEAYRLLTLAGAAWSYEDVLRYVKVFPCGIKADPSWATAGTTVTVELRVYEVVDGEETGNSYVVRGYTHTY